MDSPGMGSQDVGLVLLPMTVFCGAFLGTAAVRRVAERYGWVVLPRADRWHKKPTALHGGVGFYPAFFAGVVWICVRKYGIDWSEWRTLAHIPPDIALAAAALLGSLLMFGVGLWDDVYPVRPATKLAYQLVAASLFVSMGGIFPLTGLQVVDLLVTYLWFVSITNAVNMLDNMDGLSSGVVIVASMTVVILAIGAHGLAFGGALAVPLGLVFSAALVGFWVHNRPPAAIFMGDSGSLFIGYILAALTIPSPLNGFMGLPTVESILQPVLALLIPATVLAIPIFDTTLVTITRTWRAQKVSQGGRDHSSHRLVGLGLSERQAVWVLYTLAAFGGTVAVLMQHFPDQTLPLCGLYGLVLLFTGVYLGRVKVQVVEPGRIPRVWTPLVSYRLYKRHAAEVLLDTVLITLCLYAAYLLRFEGVLAPPMTRAMVRTLPLGVSSYLLAYCLVGIYRGQWRLIAVADLPRYAAGAVGGMVLSLALVSLITPFASGQSRSVYVICGVLVFVAMVGSRLSFRLLDVLFLQRRADRASASQQPVLVYGAGRAGKLLHEEMLSNPQMRAYVVVGYVDDDPHKVGRKLCGVPIKQGTDWRRRPWPTPPEIWISSRFVPDTLAQRLARQWPGQTMVRRLRLEMAPGMEGLMADPMTTTPPEQRGDNARDGIGGTRREGKEEIHLMDH